MEREDPQPCPICEFPTGWFKPLQKDFRLLDSMFRNSLIMLFENPQLELPGEFIAQLKNQLKLIQKIRHYIFS